MAPRTLQLVSLLIVCVSNPVALWAEHVELVTIRPDTVQTDTAPIVTVQTVTIHVQLTPDEVLFKDSISFVISNPTVHVTAWTTTAPTHMYVNRKTGASQPAYKGLVPFTVTLTSHGQEVTRNSLFFHYMVNTHKFPQERQFNLVEPTSPPAPDTHLDEPIQKARLHNSHTTATSVGMPACATTTERSFISRVYEYAHVFIRNVQSIIAAKKVYLSNLFINTESRSLQLAIALALGILMSLTPCIYPMIPVTVGLLGTSPANTFLRNFMLALSYTLGLASVFALLGFSVVFFGSQCGTLFCSPWFVALIIIFLGYSGGSMLGLYEFYIPRFLQPSSHRVKQGSIISAFFFGMASGTFASPCMSPGLALILSVVAKLGSHLIGFLLLFMFGIGASMPLLIIGTFSGALSLLPRAGKWMDDIKKFFGFMLILTCFYYAQSLVPYFVAVGGAASFTLICGLVYSTRLMHVHKLGPRLFISAVSILMIASGLFLAYVSITSYAVTTRMANGISPWHTHYADAREIARNEGKLLLLDFTASWCTLCVLLDKQILSHPGVTPIFDATIAVKVDGSLSSNVEYRQLTEQFEIFGIPTLLLINPETEEVIHQWHSELLEHPAQEFTSAVLQYTQKHSSP